MQQPVNQNSLTRTIKRCIASASAAVMIAMLIMTSSPGLYARAAEQPAAAPVKIVDGYTYSDAGDGGINLTGYTGQDTKLVIPDTLDDKKVTEIGDSVTTIGKRAFYNCEMLSRINGAALKELGDYAFERSEVTDISGARFRILDVGTAEAEVWGEQGKCTYVMMELLEDEIDGVWYYFSESGVLRK